MNLDDTTEIIRERAKVQNPITIPVKLRKNGYDYTLTLRGNRSLIYCQHVSEKTKYFEVFTIRLRSERKIIDVELPAKEKFPSNDDFGYSAWTYRDFNKAKRKFNELERS